MQATKASDFHDMQVQNIKLQQFVANDMDHYVKS
jgi:hypothetical protein